MHLHHGYTSPESSTARYKPKRGSAIHNDPYIQKPHTFRHMSETRIPITDAFDTTDQLESLEVELTAEQIEWLRTKADERGLSVDHMLRTIITAQMRAEGDEETSASAPSPGDGMAESPPATVSPTEAEASTDTNEADDNTPSIVDSLRSASERLQDLTEKDDDAETPAPHDTLKRLQARLGENGESDTETNEEERPGTVILQNENRSMFDMMEDE